MGSNYDSARLEVLAAEVRLVEGPLRAWKHLPIENLDTTLEETTEQKNSLQSRDSGGDAMEGVEESGSDDDWEDEHSSDEEDENERYRRQDQVLERILKDICSLVRKSESCSDYDVLVQKAQALIDESAVIWCSNSGEAITKSFAQSAEYPLIDDGPFDKTYGNGWFVIGRMLQDFLGDIPGTRRIDGPNGMKRTAAWPDSFRPHPLSTKLSRFKDSVEVTPTHEEPIANAVYTAHCEIIDARTRPPVYMRMSPNAEIILRGFTTGWRDCTSNLRYHLLDQPTLNANSASDVLCGDLGHADHVRGTTFEESRKLFFTADWDRVKSFRWGPVGENSGEPYKHALPVHTFQSGTWAGPLATLPFGEGRLIRAGTGSAGVWNLDSAPTHGESGGDRIGEEYNNRDNWRDDPENIETSSGSPWDSTITFEDSGFTPTVWHAHPSQPGIMLTGANYEKSKTFAFVEMDLEGGGKFVLRHLGHGGQVTQISTVEGQPHTFVTSCMDGLVRFWDTRMVLPALTLQAAHEPCMAAVYANPDGIPTVFTGAGHEEHIRLWDIRARTPVYELGTGNNRVEALSWDHKRNHLWAATAADSKEHGYRQAIVPPGQETQWDDERRWPERAYHWEDYFGIMFDAGGSRLYRFAFKEEPDITILPAMDII